LVKQYPKLHTHTHRQIKTVKRWFSGVCRNAKRREAPQSVTKFRFLFVQVRLPGIYTGC